MHMAFESRLHIQFWFVCTEDRAQWFPEVRNMSQNHFQVLNGKFQETWWCIFPEWKMVFTKTLF